MHDFNSMKTTELEKEATLLKERLAEKGTTLAVPHNFAMTVEPHLSPPAIPEKPTRTSLPNIISHHHP